MRAQDTLQMDITRRQHDKEKRKVEEISGAFL